MKKRFCDAKDCCREIIGPFYKVCLSTYQGKKLKLEHAADLCDDCFNNLMGKNK
jgi:hypothetical protein